MPQLSYFASLLLIPGALLVSLPLLPFAIFTTGFAILCLLLRAIFIYAELAGALLRQLVLPESPALSIALADYSLKSQPLFSFSSSGSVTPRRPSTPYVSYGAPPPPPPIGSAGAGSVQGSGFYGHGQGSMSSHSVYMQPSAAGSRSSGFVPSDRDYEGVGGWRDAMDEDAATDAQWTSMNRRLELPHTIGRPAHRRSLTGGPIRPSLDRGLSAVSLKSMRGHNGAVSGGKSRHSGSGDSGHGTDLRSGTVSPEEGLTMKTRSMFDIGMNVGRARGGERRKSGSSGSNSSGNSHRAMNATTGSGWMAP